MNENIQIDMTPEEWGQIMMVMQGGIYRVVAPLLQKMNLQFTQQMIAQQNAAQQQFRVVDNEGDAAE